MACTACEKEFGCEDACLALYDCVLLSADGEGYDTRYPAEDREQLVKQCTQGCGGRWEDANQLASCVLSTSCARLADGECFGSAEKQAETPSLPPPFPVPLPFAASLHLATSPACGAMAGEPGRCDELAQGEKQTDCLFGEAMRQAAQAGGSETCRRLEGQQRLFCEAVASAGPEACDGLSPDWRIPCRRYYAGTPKDDISRMLLAVSRKSSALCAGLEDQSLREFCPAAVHGTPSLCPHLVRVDAEAFERAGRLMQKERVSPTPAEPPPMLPHIYGLLSILAVAFLCLLPLWAGALVRSLYAFSRLDLCLAGLAAALFGTVRYLVVLEGPINFVEYERLLPPDTLDLGRLAYSGQALLLHPLFALVGTSFSTAFHFNTLLAALTVVVVYKLVREESDSPWPAFLAALVLGLCPPFLRAAATASEGVGFAFLTLVAFDLLLHKGKPAPAVWFAIFLPLLLVYRPEGLFFFVPFLWLAAVRMRAECGGNPWPERAFLALAVLEFVLFAFLQTMPAPPHIRPGLLAHNASLFLPQLVSPRLLSPLLVTGAFAVWLLPLLRRGRPGLVPGLVAIPIWMTVLIILWSVQGPEGNRVFGATRYAVMLLPLAAVSWGMQPRLWYRPVTVFVGIVPLLLLLLSGLPQTGLLTVESNIQKEYRFLEVAADKLPVRALLVMPTAQTSGNQEFSPENSILAMVATSDQGRRWLSTRELVGELSNAKARKRLSQGPPIILIRGLYPDPVNLGRLRRLCRFETLWEQTTTSVPDVAYYALHEEGKELVQGLYRLYPD